MIYGWNFSLNLDFDEVWSFNFAESTWTEIEIDRSQAYYDLIPRDAYAGQIVGDKVFIHGGVSKNGLNNDMYVTSLDTIPLVWE
jgi:hypothetical protein